MLDRPTNNWQLISGWTNLSIKAMLQLKVSTNIAGHQNFSLQLLCILGRKVLAKFIPSLTVCFLSLSGK